MKNLASLLFLAFFLVFSSSCATLVSHSSYPVQLNSSPEGAKVVITNEKNEEVFSGTTPVKTKLKASNEFFKPANYLITFNKEGYDTKVYPLTATIDGWYYGNIFLGGLIGMLVVDPATGAMYKIENRKIEIELAEKPLYGENQKRLEIFAIDDVPTSWKSKMEFIGHH